MAGGGGEEGDRHWGADTQGMMLSVAFQDGFIGLEVGVIQLDMSHTFSLAVKVFSPLEGT